MAIVIEITETYLARRSLWRRWDLDQGLGKAIIASYIRAKQSQN